MRWASCFGCWSSRAAPIVQAVKQVTRFSFLRSGLRKLAGWTGLEPATFCVTGRRSNQLSYHPERWEVADARIEVVQVK